MNVVAFMGEKLISSYFQFMKLGQEILNVMSMDSEDTKDIWVFAATFSI
jgi:hypothetical protein